MERKIQGIFHSGNGAGDGLPGTNARRGFLTEISLILLLFTACARQPAPRPAPPPPEPKTVEPLPELPKDLYSPQREASQKVLRQGEAYLAGGEIEKAVQTFQEAVNIDHDNGIAYYYLGKAMYFSGQYEDALGVLDRAEALLVRYPEWLDEVLRLKLYVSEAKERAVREEEKYF